MALSPSCWRVQESLPEVKRAVRMGVLEDSSSLLTPSPNAHGLGLYKALKYANNGWPRFSEFFLTFARFDAIGANHNPIVR
jgi:hypothetical protein